MKKSLWGYNVQEVDETIEYFEANQAKLNKKVKQLTEEMDSVRQEFEGKNKRMEEQAQVHADEMKAAAAEKAVLESKIAELEAKVAEYDQTKDELDRVGEICRTAYDDMNQTKKSLRASLTDFLGEFWKRWESRLKKVEDMEKHLADINAQGKDEFLKFTERMLKQYQTIHDETEDFSKEITDITTMKYEMQSELATIIRTLQIDAQPISDEKMETVYRVIQDKRANESIVEKIGDHVI